MARLDARAPIEVRDRAGHFQDRSWARGGKAEASGWRFPTVFRLPPRLYNAFESSSASFARCVGLLLAAESLELPVARGDHALPHGCGIFRGRRRPQLLVFHAGLRCECQCVQQGAGISKRSAGSSAACSGTPRRVTKISTGTRIHRRASMNREGNVTETARAKWSPRPSSSGWRISFQNVC